MANPRLRTVLAAHLAGHEDDEHGQQRGYIKGTDFALPYFFAVVAPARGLGRRGPARPRQLRLPVDARGGADVARALKQHAQSLCILIHALNPTLRSAEIISGDPSKAPGGKERTRGGEGGRGPPGLQVRAQLGLRLPQRPQHFLHQRRRPTTTSR
ncbi:hypothetical protein VTK56DRAFT_7510 [Thermocarpiscus australiensis]